MLPSLRIYAFDDPVRFLNAEFRRMKLENKKFSLREWARTLGYKNPSYLSDVLKGRRRLKISVASLLARDLHLDEGATRYLELMVLVAQAKDAGEKRHLAKLLDSLRPAELRGTTPKSLEQFSLIADWHNFALMEMPQLRDFRSDLKSISARLRHRVPTEALEDSLRLLVEFGFLTRDPDGTFRRALGGAFVLEPEMQRMAVREYQRQMAQHALASLDDQKSAEIDFQGTTISFEKKNLEAFRRLAREFHRQALALASPGQGDEVYQLNSQFFRLT